MTTHETKSKKGNSTKLNIILIFKLNLKDNTNSNKLFNILKPSKGYIGIKLNNIIYKLYLKNIL